MAITYMGTQSGGMYVVGDGTTTTFTIDFSDFAALEPEYIKRGGVPVSMLNYGPLSPAAYPVTAVWNGGWSVTYTFTTVLPTGYPEQMTAQFLYEIVNP
jgi:hypothetical protein